MLIQSPLSHVPSKVPCQHLALAVCDSQKSLIAIANGVCSLVNETSVLTVSSVPFPVMVSLTLKFWKSGTEGVFALCLPCVKYQKIAIVRFLAKRPYGNKSAMVRFVRFFRLHESNTVVCVFTSSCNKTPNV